MDTRIPDLLSRTSTPVALRRPRLKDIAAEANIAVSTASMALANHPAVSDATKSKVHGISRRLRYRKRGQAALALRFGMLFLDGRIMRDLYADFLTSLLSFGKRMDIRVELAAVDAWGNNPSAIDEALEFCEPLDGVLLMDAINTELFDRLKAAHVPYVILGNSPGPIREPGGPTVTTVAWDDIGMGYVATRALLDAGHRRIAFVVECTPAGLTHDRWRRGFQLAHLEAGHAVDPRLIVVTGQRELGAEPAVAVLEKLDAPPTAYIVPDTRIAASLVHALRQRGTALPHDALVYAGTPSIVQATAMHDYAHLLACVDQLAEQGLHQLQRLYRRPDSRPVEVLVPFRAVKLPGSVPAEPSAALLVEPKESVS